MKKIIMIQRSYYLSMYNDKFNKPFVDFLNANFNKNEHMILCCKKHSVDLYPFPEGDHEAWTS